MKACLHYLGEIVLFCDYFLEMRKTLCFNGWIEDWTDTTQA